jgi:hypothetical protein
MSPSKFLSWYWAPYVVGLGLLDWWDEVTQVTHSQAIERGVSTLKRRKHSVLRSAASLVLLCALIFFIARNLLAPWLGSKSFNPSATQLLSGAALLAALAFLTGLWLVSRALLRGLNQLYQRGLGRLARSTRPSG